MTWGRAVVIVAVSGLALVLSASGAAQERLFTRVATRSCLLTLPHSVAGLPPARPPVPPLLFAYTLAHDDVSTWEGVGPRPREHTQLGVWSGDKLYEGVILSFFKSARDARASLRTVAWLYGGKRIGNVVATWDQKALPSRSMRDTVFGCLRSGRTATPNPPAPPASLATFAGYWGGHTRGLSITSNGRGAEYADDGCCHRVYQMTYQIMSVTGTLTRGIATYRVTSFRRYESGVRKRDVGDVGTLLLRNGIVTNTLTRDYFCSDPAWGATGACGA